MRRYALISWLLAASLVLNGCYFFVSGNDDDDDSTGVADDDDDDVVLLEPDELIGTWRMVETLSDSQPDDFCSPFVRGYSEEMTEFEYDGIYKDESGNLRFYLSQNVFANVVYDAGAGNYAMSFSGTAPGPIGDCKFKFDVLGNFTAEAGEETGEITGQYSLLNLGFDPATCDPYFDVLTDMLVANPAQQYVEDYFSLANSFPCSMKFTIRGTKANENTDLADIGRSFYDTPEQLTEEILLPDPPLLTCEPFMTAGNAIPLDAADCVELDMAERHAYSGRLILMPNASTETPSCYSPVEQDEFPKPDNVVWYGDADTGVFTVNNGATGKVCSDGRFWTCAVIPAKLDVGGSMLSVDSVIFFTGKIDPLDGELVSPDTNISADPFVLRTQFTFFKSGDLWPNLSRGDLICGNSMAVDQLAPYTMPR